MRYLSTRAAAWAGSIAVVTVLAAVLALGAGIPQGWDAVTEVRTSVFPPDARPQNVLVAGAHVFATALEANTIVALDQTGTVLGKVVSEGPLLAAATDETGGCVYALSLDPPEIIVIDAAEVRESRRASLPHAPRSMHVRGTTGYICRFRDPMVDVLDLSSLQVQGTIPVTAWPIKSTVLGGRLFVSCGKMMFESGYELVPGTVDIIDLDSTQVTSTVTISGAYPSAIVSDGQRYVYVAALEGALRPLQRIDADRGQLDADFAVPIEGRPYDMVLDPVRGMIYLSCTGREAHLVAVSIAEKRQTGSLRAGDVGIAACRDANGSITQLLVADPSAHSIAIVDPDDIPYDPLREAVEAK